MSVEETARRRLALSIHLLETHKDSFLEAVETMFRPHERPDEETGQTEVTAMVLTELLLSQARTLVVTGALAVPPTTGAEHHMLDITGRHYSRFGDGLVAVLRDVLGPTLPSDVAAAWGDTFWAIIAEIRSGASASPKTSDRLAIAGA